MEKQKTVKYKVLVDLGQGLQIIRIHVDQLIEQDINARTFTPAAFNQLVSNVKERQALESVPYCCLTERGVEILSGHHRVRAARKAGVMSIVVLLDTVPYSREEKVAKQLAHNSLQGFDDPQLLARLFSEIQDAELKLAAFIDPLIIDKELAPVEIPDIMVDYQFQRVGLLFLPYQLENFTHVIDSLTGEETALYVAPIEHWDKFKEACRQLMVAENIKSVGMAVSRMSELVLEKLKSDKPTAHEKVSRIGKS